MNQMTMLKLFDRVATFEEKAMLGALDDFSKLTPRKLKPRNIVVSLITPLLASLVVFNIIPSWLIYLVYGELAIGGTLMLIMVLSWLYNKERTDELLVAVLLRELFGKGTHQERSRKVFDFILSVSNIATAIALFQFGTTAALVFAFASILVLVVGSYVRNQKELFIQSVYEVWRVAQDLKGKASNENETGFY